MRNSSAHASKSRSRIGTIQSVIGLITVERVGIAPFQACRSDVVYVGDAIAAGADSSVTIAIDDGSLVRLSANSRALLTEPDQPGAIVAVALAKPRRSRNLFDTGRSERNEDARSPSSVTVRERAQGLGLRILSFAILAYALLRDVEHARALTTDDDTITPKDSEYGTFEIVTKSGTVILVDDPALTYVVDDDGSVERRINSSARMEDLQAAQQAVLGTLNQGFAGPGGSGNSLDSPGLPQLQDLIVPINFRSLDPVPERFAPDLIVPLVDTPVFVAPPPPPPSPPVITTFTLDSGIDGDRITNNNTLTLIGTATPGTIVSIFDSGALIGTTTANAGGTWSFDTGPLPDGEHAFAAAAGAPEIQTTARATFSAFASFAVAPEASVGPRSGTYVVMIDTEAPETPLVSSAAEQAGHGPTRDASPTLTITAESGSTVHIYRDGTLVGTAAESDIPGIFVFESEALSDGRYTFTATATDVANNTSEASRGFKIEVDAEAPSAPVFVGLADDCQCSDHNLTNDTTPTMIIEAEAGSTVHVYRDGSFVGTAVETGKSGIFNFTSADLTDGGHTFTATATDSAGNLSSGSAGFAVAVVTYDPNDFDDLAIGKHSTVDPDGTFHGTRGDDFIWFKHDHCEPGRTVYAGAGDDYVKGTDHDDLIYGGSGHDKLFGDNGADIVFGGFGNDKIDGGKGDDIIIGGYGADVLTGGKGEDTFMFLSELDSLPCSRDTITNFDCHRDRIDLSSIDANTSQFDDQAFIFVGQTGSSEIAANSVTWHYDRLSGHTFVLADTDGFSETAEIEIVLAGKVELTHANFVL